MSFYVLFAFVLVTRNFDKYVIISQFQLQAFLPLNYLELIFIQHERLDFISLSSLNSLVILTVIFFLLTFWHFFHLRIFGFSCWGVTDFGSCLKAKQILRCLKVLWVSIIPLSHKKKGTKLLQNSLKSYAVSMQNLVLKHI